jgi:hypothetical protein
MIDLPRVWRFNRPALASSLATRLLRQERLALYGPRQTGKTSLLREETMPMIDANGGYAVYADCWAARDDPLSSINYALQKALDNLAVPPKGVTRTLGQKVKKVGFAGASVDLADAPSRSMPASPYLQWMSSRHSARPLTAPKLPQRCALG